MQQQILRLSFWFALVLFQLVKCEPEREIERDMLKRILDPEKYDPRIRAYGNDTSAATVVSVNLYIRSINTIDDVKMRYKTQLTFRMQWLDTRLAWGHYSPRINSLPYLTMSTSSDVWIPDLFFSNELDGHIHNLLKPNTYIRIFPDGQVLYSTRISLTLSCPMVLKLYPMDKQTCSMRMASYGFTTADLIFEWKRDDPVQVTPDLHLPKFALEQFTTDYCDSHTNTGVYSCLRVDMLFKREFSAYLIQVYIPTIMLVLVAYLAFWIDPKEINARLAMTLVSLFVMAIATGLFNASLPPVSYTKAIDVWTGMCLTFVFGALMMCVLVHYCGKKEPRSPESDVTPLDPNEIQSDVNKLQKYIEICWPQKMDVIARIFYPACFLLFCIVYWAAYL